MQADVKIARVHREPMHKESSTAAIMDHVLARRSGVNTRGRVGRESTPRTSRVVLDKPVTVTVLPGGNVDSRRSSFNDRALAYKKDTKIVQWYDPAHRGKYRVAARPGVKGITGKLQFQGVNEKGAPIWK